MGKIFRFCVVFTQLLTLKPAGTVELGSQYSVSCDDLIEALGWSRPETLKLTDDAVTPVKGDVDLSTNVDVEELQHEPRREKAVRISGVSGDK